MIVCNVHLRKKHLQSYFFSYKMRDSYGGWVAQLVEQRIENPRVGGSIPSRATIFMPASQDVRLFLYRGVAQPGRAPALGAGCRRFESCRPDARHMPTVANSVTVGIDFQ